MSIKQILKAKLEERGYLTINDVIKIAEQQGCYYDTLRRKAEGIGIKHYNSKGHIAGWSLPSQNTKKKPQEARGEVLKPKADNDAKQPNLFNTAPPRKGNWMYN